MLLTVAYLVSASIGHYELMIILSFWSGLTLV